MFLPSILFVVIQSSVEHPVGELLYLYHNMNAYCLPFEQYILQSFYSVVVSAAAVLDDILQERKDELEHQVSPRTKMV